MWADVDGRTKGGKWALFLLPLITVLREGTSRFLHAWSSVILTLFAANRDGSRYLRRRRLSWTASYIYPHRYNCRHGMRSHMRGFDLCIC